MRCKLGGFRDGYEWRGGKGKFSGRIERFNIHVEFFLRALVLLDAETSGEWVSVSVSILFFPFLFRVSIVCKVGKRLEAPYSDTVHLQKISGSSVLLINNSNNFSRVGTSPPNS